MNAHRTLGGQSEYLHASSSLTSRSRHAKEARTVPVCCSRLLLRLLWYVTPLSASSAGTAKLKGRLNAREIVVKTFRFLSRRVQQKTGRPVARLHSALSCRSDHGFHQALESSCSFIRLLSFSSPVELQQQSTLQSALSLYPKK